MKKYSKICANRAKLSYFSNAILEKNRYAMRTCVCYLEIQRSRGKEGNARFANKGHLGFDSLAFGFHC